MFDKTTVVHAPQTGHVTKTVNIHRQSTADDARLLSDLEKEAVAKVKNIILHDVQDTNMQFVTYDYYLSAADQRHQTFIAFTLNGDRYHINVDEDIINIETTDWVGVFYKRLSETIAHQLITNNKVLDERYRTMKFSDMK